MQTSSGLITSQAPTILATKRHTQRNSGVTDYLPAQGQSLQQMNNPGMAELYQKVLDDKNIEINQLKHKLTHIHNQMVSSSSQKKILTAQELAKKQMHGRNMSSINNTSGTNNNSLNANG